VDFVKDFTRYCGRPDPLALDKQLFPLNFLCRFQFCSFPYGVVSQTPVVQSYSTAFKQSQTHMTLCIEMNAIFISEKKTHKAKNLELFLHILLKFDII